MNKEGITENDLPRTVNILMDCYRYAYVLNKTACLPSNSYLFLQENQLCMELRQHQPGDTEKQQLHLLRPPGQLRQVSLRLQKQPIKV